MSYVSELSELLGEDRVKGRLIDRHSYARDASFYRLIPQVIVQPKDETDIQALFKYSQSRQIPLVFRAAGTSLSGQAITDGILVEVAEGWRDQHYHPATRIIDLEPGLIGGRVNRYLSPLGRKIGPDPASLDACLVGGIVANNASGMCCGVKDNAYHTLDTLRFILPNGHVYDTLNDDANQQLKENDPGIFTGLTTLRKRVTGDKQLFERVRDKYSRKNTLGYSLNAFIDYERPIDILAHLLVGSEGTLGFISRVRLKTLADEPYKSTAILFFRDIRSATETVHPLEKAGAEALELMDRAALRAIENEPGMLKEIKALPEAAAGLLCEFQASTQADLARKVESGMTILREARLLHPPNFTEAETTRLNYWKIRKGLFPSVGAVRKSGTTVIIEDICFRLENLADATLELQGLFTKHGYDDAIIFGHAKDGNLHFVISQEFADEAGRKQYEQFMKDVVTMTAGKYDGALKAEHGTGRNMAPFLETEWGEVAVSIMRDLKNLIDPQNVLNPGVIINDDKQVYLKNIKPTPGIDEVVDKCIECGFCETWCPSSNLTMTPRRRIAAWREIKFLEQGDFTDRELARVLLKDYRYESVDTCAVDGLCALGCPVKIDTGDLVRHFRKEAHSFVAQRIALWTVRYFSLVVEVIRLGLNLVTPVFRLAGAHRIVAVSKKLYHVSRGRIPVWHRFMPTGGRGVPIIPLRNPQGNEEVVYFVSCLNRGMDRIPGEQHKLNTAQAFIALLQEAGIHPIYPAHLEDLCCGTPYSSKGYDRAFRLMAEKTVASLWRTSRQGTIPIVVDTSPCTFKMQHYDSILEGEALKTWEKLKIVDILEYLNDRVVPNLEIRHKATRVVLHPTCSTRKMGLENVMHDVACACAEEAIIPEQLGCCGFAGDRGFLVPELTESATRHEAEEVRTLDHVQGHYSTSRTCEMGMSNTTEASYSSIIHLLYHSVFG